MAREKYKAVNQCIYCMRRAVTLTDEHIVALAIGGNSVLPKATCIRCQKLTSKLELHCFRETLKPFRTQTGLWGRRKKHAPGAFDLHIQNRETKTWIAKRLAIVNYPALLVLPELPEVPGILEGREPNPDTSVGAWGHLTNSDYLKSYEDHRVLLAAFHPGKWCRVLAKSAHAYAVAELGLDAFRPLLPRLIRGIDNAPTHLIGSTRVPAAAESELHRIDLTVIDSALMPGTQLLAAKLRLFGKYGAPLYLIIVGELTRRLTTETPQSWPPAM